MFGFSLLHNNSSGRSLLLTHAQRPNHTTIDISTPGPSVHTEDSRPAATGSQQAGARSGLPDTWKPDPASPLPLHGQISAHFLAKISTGAWPPGMRLAPQRELSRQLGVNRSTVVTALGQLTALGLIEGRRGGRNDSYRRAFNAPGFRRFRRTVRRSRGSGAL